MNGHTHDELYREIVVLKARIMDLEERVAFAELGRDNAIVMRDEAQRMKKQAGESAARRINALVALVRELAPAEMCNGCGRGGTQVVERKIDDILKK